MIVNLFAVLAAVFCVVTQPHQKDPFNHVVSRAVGDLNNDQFPDLVIVKQDTTAHTSPYRIQIFFGKPGGGRVLVLSSTTAISPKYRFGKDGYRDGDVFSSIQIHKNVLTIERELLRGHYRHKFRYQNGNFELIGYNLGVSDGQGFIYDTDFNLSTGLLLFKKESYDGGDFLENKKKILKIRPLPRLQHYDPEEQYD